MALLPTSRISTIKRRTPSRGRGIIKLCSCIFIVSVAVFIVLSLVKEAFPQNVHISDTVPASQAHNADQHIIDNHPVDAIAQARANLGGKSYIEERPWQEAAPTWCKQLIENPRERVRGSGNCGQGPFGAVCADGMPRFFGQENQDMWVWMNHFKNLKRRGVYLDIAANEPMEISNTYFFDKCLGWRGLCVEAYPRYFPNLIKMRSCGLVPTCVSDKEENVSFVMYLGLSGVVETNKNTQILNSPRMELTCVPTSRAIDAGGMPKIDLLSLDVEGHEHKVLQGIDWKRTRINVIIIESLQPHTETMLIELGYRKLDVPSTPEEKAKEGALYQDAVFIRNDVTWGAPI